MVKAKDLLLWIHDTIDNIKTTYAQGSNWGGWNGWAFMLDCIIFIKCLVYWGWYYPDKTKEHGGATYIKKYDWTEIELIQHCTEVSYNNFLLAVPCELLYMSGHCGFKIDEFIRNGRTYNVAECTWAELWGAPRKCLYSYVDDYGNRYEYKGGRANGAWVAHGKLYGIDYSEAPTQHLDAEGLANAIMIGYLDGRRIGNEPERSANLKAWGYTEEEIRAAQDIVNAKKKKHLSAEELAEAIMDGYIDGMRIGNEPERSANLKAWGYTEEEIRAAQDIVNARKSGHLNVDELAEAICNGYLEGKKIGNVPERITNLKAWGYSDEEIRAAQDIVNERKTPKEGKPLTKEDCEVEFRSMSAPSMVTVQAAATKLGLDNNEFIGILGWVQGEGYWSEAVQDPYLAYLSACVVINNILEGNYGHGYKVLEKIASWGSYYSIAKQKDRAENPSEGALKATYLGLKYLQKGIYCCYGPGHRPENCFYDPHFKTQGEWIYVF